MSQTNSARLYQRALKVMPGGCSRNTILRKPHPYYAESANGCYVTDIDGNRRIDFANNMASLIHGHAHPEVIRKVGEQLHKGSAFTLATEVELLFAEELCSRSRGFQKIRFVNSGTEAVMSCLKAARAFTGRPKIAKVEGAYHGLYDYAEVSQTSSADNWGDISQPRSVPVAHGTPVSALNDVVVIPFNDADTAIKILSEHKNELACVLLDLLPHRIGLIPASEAFVNAIRQWTRDNQVLMVCDEVITFRSQMAGAQQNYNCIADLTAMGKVIGGGFPVGAITGREDIMDVMNPLADKVLFPHSGTFSANPITMTAGLTTMKLFDEAAVKRLNTLGDLARKNINEVINIAAVPACVTGCGSLFRVHLQANPPANYRDTVLTGRQSGLLKKLLDHLFDNGIMMINTCSFALSTVMTENEINQLSEVMLSGLRKLSPELQHDQENT